MRLFAALVLTVLALPAFAVGPQDMVVTFATRAGGGAPTGHVLYVNDVAKGSIVSGVTVPAAQSGITGNGTWKVCVQAVNASGSTAGGNCITSTITDPLQPPGPTDVVTLIFTCQTTTPQTCVVTQGP